MSRSGGLSQHCRAMLLHSMFGQSSSALLSPPPSVWFGVSLAPIDPSKSGYKQAEPPTVSPGGEPTGYARAGFPLQDNEHWQSSGLSAVTNSVEVRFPAAQQPWGLLRYWMMMDDPDSGSVLAFGEFPYVVPVDAGDVLVLSPGGIHISLDSYDTEW